MRAAIIVASLFVRLEGWISPCTSPTDEEAQAQVDYNTWVQDQVAAREGLTSLDDAFNAILSPQGQETLRTAKEPRIFMATSELLSKKHPCTFEFGMRYSIESQLRTFLFSDQMSKSESADDADFVYFPHCGMSVYMGLLTHYAQRVSLKRLAKYTDTSGFVVPVLAAVESEYMLPLAERIRSSWAYQSCMSRVQRMNSICRPLFVNFFGRHFMPTFASLFPTAVVVTNAADSSWLRTSADGTRLFWWKTSPMYGASRSQEFPQLSLAAERPTSLYYSSCLPEPVTILDIPLPLPIASQWTEASGEWESRDLFAVFVGQLVSNERKALLHVFGEYGETETIYPGVRLHIQKRLPIHEFSALMHRSKLCLVPDGDQPNTERLAEAAAHGCVPVVISSRLQPHFHGFIDWKKCAIFVRSSEVARLPELLDELRSQPALLREMHGRMRGLAAALVWGFGQHSPFYTRLLLAELSRRTGVSDVADTIAREKLESVADVVANWSCLPADALPVASPLVRRLRFPFKAFEIPNWKRATAKSSLDGRGRPPV